MHQQNNIENVRLLGEEAKNIVEQNINDIGICYSDAKRNWQMN